MKQHLTTLLCAALLLPLQAQDAPRDWLDWHETPADACAAAKAEKKDILAIYRGEDDSTRKFAHLLLNPHFRERAQGQFVLLVQDMPAEAREEHAAMLFCDAAGQPYYFFDSEVSVGLDWVMEELLIAAERKAAVQALRPAPGGAPDGARLNDFFAAMPIGIERYSASYRRMLEELAAQGDRRQAARRAEAGKLEAEFRRIIEQMNAADDAMAFCQEQTARLRDASPLLYQPLWLLSSATPALYSLSMEGRQQDLRELCAQAIALEPRSKCARYIRKATEPCLRAFATMAELSPYYRSEPERALARLGELRAEGGRSYMERQCLAILEGRVLAELGRWDAACAKLGEAVECDPLSENAQAAGELGRRILFYRKELDELLPLRRRGDAEVDARWDALLGITMTWGMRCQFSNFDLYFDNAQ